MNWIPLPSDFRDIMDTENILFTVLSYLIITTILRMWHDYPNRNKYLGTNRLNNVPKKTQLRSQSVSKHSNSRAYLKIMIAYLHY